MKKLPYHFLLLICIVSNRGLLAQKQNSLTPSEQKAGWVLLFDGKTAKGWQHWNKPEFPTEAWEIKDGELVSKLAELKDGGDIVTTENYSNFELTLDFKITKGANSGIKYFYQNYEQGGWLGLEYQVLDNATTDEGKIPNHVCGSLYDMFKPNADVSKPVGQWNTIKIISKGNHVEHWLNGKMILAFELTSNAFKNALAQSKYKNAVPAFGSIAKGRILLQHHGSVVAFRNIKLKKLK